MSGSAASGERSAVRGYQRQYDWIAAAIYDALLDDDLVGVRLTDPEAGKVDDLVLIRGGTVHGYQFKSAESPGTITFQQLLTATATRSGTSGPSLARALAHGWQALHDTHGTAHVHLVTEDHASVNDRLMGSAAEGPQHFAAFLREVLIRLFVPEVGVSDSRV